MTQKYILFNTCVVFPRSTLLLIISSLFLLVNGIFSLFGVTEFVAPEEWRWVICGLDLFMSLSYVAWLLSIIFNIKNRTRSGKRHKSKTSFSIALELQHVMTCAVLFVFFSCVWAGVMGIKGNDQFLIIMNVTNYVILKIFYGINFVLCGICISTVLNFTSDYLEMASKQ